MPLPARADVPVEETWNLGDIYPSPASWEAAIDQLNALVATVEQYRGRLGESGGALLNCLRARDAVAEVLTKVDAYGRLGVSTDGHSPEAQAQAVRGGAVAAQVEASLSFITTELTALPDGAIEHALASVQELATYRRQLEDILKRKAHVLAAETEHALASLGEALSAPSTIWGQTTAVDVRCETIHSASGQELPVSIAAYVFGYSHAADRAVREAGYQSLGAGMHRHVATLSTTLGTHIKRNVVLAKLRHYSSATAMILESQHVPETAYRNVLNVVHDEIAPHYRRLMRLKQRVLGLDKVCRWDVDAPLDPDFEPPTTFEEAASLVKSGLAVLGSEYAGIVEAAFRDRWIDRAENTGKRSGAFCSTVYGVHSYVFTTWRNTLRNAFTLAHELGHAGHGVLAGRNQVISNTRPALFFIEAPSTANELLLGNAMVQSSTDPRFRRWVVLQFLGTFTHNMVTHLLEAHFEQRLYDLAEAGKPITQPVILQTQREVFERFYAGSVEVDDNATWYWAQQPHFYTGLYPYTYAAGLSCAVSVAEAIRQEGQPAVDRWLTTLKAGGTLDPVDLMRLAGVDMTTAAPISKAVAFFGNLVDELERSFT